MIFGISMTKEFKSGVKVSFFSRDGSLEPLIQSFKLVFFKL